MKLARFLLLICSVSFAKDDYMLPFLYKLFHKPLSTRSASKACGVFADSPKSARFIPWFIKHYKVKQKDLKDTEERTFTSLNDFFTRKLKPHARKIEEGIVSPADGSITIFNNIQRDTSILVKGKPFNLKKFLGVSENAEDFYGGSIAIIYLAPSNYHRYHAPIECMPAKAIQIKGRYESVSPLAYKKNIQPLTENERQLITLNDHCRMIIVGAMCVGRITQTYKPGALIQKGSELGYFSFGGSTVVLVTKPGYAMFKKSFTQESQSILMGQQIGSLITNQPLKKRIKKGNFI